MEVRNALTRTSTLSKTTDLGLVWGIAEWADGTLILSDAERHTICNLVLPSSVNVIAGSGTPGFFDGVGDKAMFNTPKGISLMEDASVLVADSGNNRIRMVSSGGSVSTISGTGKRGTADGIAKNATWDLPIEIAHISSGPNENRILVASFNSPYLRCIHEGIVSTLSYHSTHTAQLTGSMVLYGNSLLTRSSTSASTDASDASSSASPSSGLVAPSSTPKIGPPKQKSSDNTPISPDLQSPIFSFVRQVGSPHLSRILAQLEDRLMNGSNALVDGMLEDASFKSLNAMISNTRGDLIVMDGANHAVRLITIEGRVSTISGAGYPGHRDGVTNQTRLSFPRTMLLTRQGEIIIADTGNCCLRRIELAAAIRPMWLQNAPKPRHFNHLLPIEASSASASSLSASGSLSSSASLVASGSPNKSAMYARQEPRWTDLVWGTSSAGTWRLHRCIVYPRCPSLMDSAIQTKFLDMRVSVQAFGAFWEFIYNDQFPLSKGDFASATLLIEFLALLQCVKLDAAEAYATWLLGWTIDALPTVEELVGVVPALLNFKLIEVLKTSVRILSRRADNPKVEDAMRQIAQMATALDDPVFITWLKRRNNVSASYSRKLGDKPPTPSPFGHLENSLSTLLIRDEHTGRFPYPDMAIKVQVDQLSCHRAILYKRWPLLMSCIESSLLDPNAPLVFSMPPELAHMRIASLYGILWYFYTGSLEKLADPEECTDLAQLWPHLQIEDLKIRTYILQNGFVHMGDPEESATETQGPPPNLWVQPVEPPPSSCNIQ